MVRLFGTHTPQWVQSGYWAAARWFLPTLMRTIVKTWSVDTVALPYETWAYLQAGHPCLFALWHGRMFSLLAQAPDVTQTGVLISPSRDGLFISETFRGLGGAKLIVGSQGREGDKATREILHYLNQAGRVAMMVDGPRGPKFKAKTGIVKLASLAQVPIIPIVADADKHTLVLPRAWDAFMAPLCFARVRCAYGAMFVVPPHLSRQSLVQYTEHLTEHMHALQNKVVSFRT
jgi:lysophospholipid acyltransferase (LPLAT)-like uncharacterized protein